MALNPRQLAFCEEYIKDHNGTQAAIRCGYSEKAAKEQASRLLTNANVMAFIQEHTAKNSSQVNEQVQSILKELLNYINSDITETVGLTPSELKALPIELRRMIASYKYAITKSGEFIELKFYDKMKALEMVNKHIGFYNEDNKQKAVNITVVPPKRD